MLDSQLKPYIDPYLIKISDKFRSYGLEANDVTLIGLFFAILTFPALLFKTYWLALILILLNRLMDGIDGFIARSEEKDIRSIKRQFGGFFDIFSDFVLYSGFVLFFALGYGVEGYFAGLFLLFAYILNAVCFFGYALFTTSTGGQITDVKKSFAFLEGIAEGTETIIYMVTCCIVPFLFPALTFIFALMCLVSAILRFYNIYKIYKTFSKQSQQSKNSD